VPCPECRGSGVIALLVSSRPCTRCGGLGRIETAAKAPEPEAQEPESEAASESYSYGAGTGAEVVCRTYDAQGRLTSETLFGGVEMTTYVLSDTGPGDGDEPLDDELDGNDLRD